MRKPFFWRGGWYIKSPTAAGGWTNRFLAEEEVAAFDLWHREQSDAVASKPGGTCASVLEAFLAWSDKHHARSTHLWYLHYLRRLAAVQGRVLVRNLKPHHLTDWVDRSAYKPGAARAAISTAQRAFAWALKQELVTRNPFVGVDLPPKGRREQLVEAVTHQAIIASIPDNCGSFRDFLLAMWESGARPGEVAKVEKRHVTAAVDAWIFPVGEHKTGRKTGRKRVVYLSPILATLTAALCLKHPEGPLFRNQHGRPWTGNAVRCRMRRLRAKLDLPAGTVAYSYRHTFTTEALERGVDVAALAELLGHGDVSMIGRHYGHLDQRAEHLKKALLKATTPSDT